MGSKKKEIWYNLSKLVEMGYSRNALIKRFYGGLKGKKPEDYGIEWHEKTVLEKAVNRKNYLKHFKGVLKRRDKDGVLK